MPLPIGGIISQEPYDKIVATLEKLSDAAKELGCKLTSPFMTLAFAGCPTLTEFKLSDKGLIDILTGKIVPLEIE